MKKFLKAIGIFFLVAILVVAGLSVWKWDIIKSVYIGLTTNSKELSQKLDDTQDAMRKNIEEHTKISIEDFSDEELALIKSGKLTKAEVFEKKVNEAIEKYLNENNSESSFETQYDRIVAKYTSVFYALKGKYIGMLDSLIGIADDEFDALPKEQRTKATRSKIISKYINVASGYEADCDKEVSSLLSSMKKDLKAINADTAIVDSIKEIYYEEKSLRISYYASKMK